MERFLVFLKKIIPSSLFLFFQPYYHRFLSQVAAFYYHYPSKEMVVIGVTGTNGKSTTTHLITKVLEARGDKTGETSTVFFKIGYQEKLNDKKMTMLGRFALQRMLREMVKEGCRYAVIETSSEGIKQFRHLGVHYDVLVFTNLTPEHLDSHGGFANYKQAKLALFGHLEKLSHKTIAGRKQEKTIVVNLDDKHAQDFLDFKVDRKIGYSIKQKTAERGAIGELIKADDIENRAEGISFKVKGEEFFLPLLGEFNVYNALAAIAVGRSLGFSQQEIKKALRKIKSMPGRMEVIKGDNKLVIVDYAPEPESLRQAYNTVKKIKQDKGRIIHVLGSCGGGRDRWRRKVLGGLAGENAQYVIVTNEDPYDDDPEEIINEVAQGVLAAGKVLGENLFKILDRREAIRKALSLAQEKDLVFITGKGCEQAICEAGGKKVPWDDRRVVKEELERLKRR